MPNTHSRSISSGKTSGATSHEVEKPSILEVSKWKKIVSEFEKPSIWKSSWQLVSTLGLYLLTWSLIYLNYSKGGPWYYYLPLILAGAGLTVRIFIIFHDCGHQSFFKKKKLNQIFGFITGYLSSSLWSPAPPLEDRAQKRILKAVRKQVHIISMGQH